MALQERLREVMETHGLVTQQDLADFVGVSKGLVGQWFNGSTGLGKKPLTAFDKKTNYSIRWLAEGTGEKFKNQLGDFETETPPEGFITYEVLDVTAHLGPGAYNDDYPQVVDLVTVAEEWAKRNLGSNYRQIKVINTKGDSMQGTINEGDVLFVDPTITHFEGEGVYVIHYADGLRAKRLQLTAQGRLKIISDNKRYETEELQPEELESLKICGRVKGSWNLSLF